MQQEGTFFLHNSGHFGMMLLIPYALPFLKDWSHCFRIKITVSVIGAEYPAVVEFAPFQRLPKKHLGRKKDPKMGTLEQDPAYISFLESKAAKPTETGSTQHCPLEYFPPPESKSLFCSATTWFKPWPHQPLLSKYSCPLSSASC